jgi:hypothetical protein
MGNLIDSRNFGKEATEIAFPSELPLFFGPPDTRDACPISEIVKRLPASNRLANPNNENSCAVFLAKPL